MEIRDQRSGGCEVAAGSGSLQQIVAGWALGSGPGLPEEESGVCVLESEPQETHSLTTSKQHPRLVEAICTVCALYKHTCFLCFEFFSYLFCISIWSTLNTLGLSLTGSGGRFDAMDQVFTSSP